MKPIEFQRGCARNSKWKSVENRNRDGREYRNDRSKTNSVVITHENPSVELRTFFSGFPLLRRIDPTGNIIPFVRSVSEKWPRIPWTDASISVKFSRDTLFSPSKTLRIEGSAGVGRETALNLWNRNAGRASFYCIYCVFVYSAY